MPCDALPSLNCLKRKELEGLECSLLSLITFCDCPSNSNFYVTGLFIFPFLALLVHELLEGRNHRLSVTVEHRLAKFSIDCNINRFCQTANSLSFVGITFCCNYSSLSLKHRNYHRQCVNEWNDCIPIKVYLQKQVAV